MGVAVGVVVDLLVERGAQPWAVGALIPLAAWSTYFVVFQLQHGVGWSPELWAGVTLMASLVGGLIGSLVSTPNPKPHEAVSAG